MYNFRLNELHRKLLEATEAYAFGTLLNIRRVIVKMLFFLLQHSKVRYSLKV